MLLNIVSPTWLHSLNVKSRRLNNIPLANRYICLLQNNVAFIFMFRLKVCCLGTLGEPNILRQLAHTIMTEMKTVKIKVIIVRLLPGLINKPGILRMNKTNIIMSLARVMVDSFAITLWQTMSLYTSIDFLYLFFFILGNYQCVSYRLFSSVCLHSSINHW